VLRLLDPGDRVLLGNDAYGGTFRLIDKVHTDLAWTAVDLIDIDRLVRRVARRHQARLAGDAHQPAAALLRHRGDLLDRSRSRRARVRRQHIRHAVPAAAVDARRRRVVHSATKYLGGHSDVVGGFLALDDDELAGVSASPRTRRAQCRHRSTAISCCAA
jgi:cystathionine gamma-synthase